MSHFWLVGDCFIHIQTSARLSENLQDHGSLSLSGAQQPFLWSVLVASGGPWVSCLTLVKMNCWFLLRRSPGLGQAHWLQVMALYKSFQVTQFHGLFWVISIRILLGFYFGFHFYIFWRAFNWTIFSNISIRILERECIIN